jgi:midasin
MSQYASELVQNWNDASFDISSITHSRPLSSPKEIMDFLHELSGLYLDNKTIDPSDSDTCDKKRRKLANGAAGAVSSGLLIDRKHAELVQNTLKEVSILYQKYTALFEWVDGPLVCSMKQGCMLLLDEMSLAEDAVLERLNSVLEPSRTITLAEKGGEGSLCAHESATTASLSSEIKAAEHFRIFATMNPGGGKFLLCLENF